VEIGSEGGSCELLFGGLGCISDVGIGNVGCVSGTSIISSLNLAFGIEFANLERERDEGSSRNSSSESVGMSIMLVVLTMEDF
jgi:hypothetical protein